MSEDAGWQTHTHGAPKLAGAFTSPWKQRNRWAMWLIGMARGIRKGTICQPQPLLFFFPGRNAMPSCLLKLSAETQEANIPCHGLVPMSTVFPWPQTPGPDERKRNTGRGGGEKEDGEMETEERKEGGGKETEEGRRERRKGEEEEKERRDR